MPSSHYTIRTMTKQDVKTAIDWAAAEGWNPGIHDAESFYVADPNGFFIGEIDGEAVATLSAVKYGDSFGFMGFYMVKPAYRGKGYGIQIWDAGIEYLTGRNIGLDGVLEQQENYKRFGFKFAYRNIRYEGINDNAVLPDNSKTIDLAAVSFESIQAYDQSFFPEERSVFLESWVRHADRHAVGIMDGEQLAGYGVIRKCRQGYKIGPLFAETPELAESLFITLRNRVEGAVAIYFDVPATNPAAVSLAEKYKMQPVFETARMYTVTTPEIPIQKLFGVTSFELG